MAAMKRIRSNFELKSNSHKNMRKLQNSVSTTARQTEKISYLTISGQVVSVEKGERYAFGIGNEDRISTAH